MSMCWRNFILAVLGSVLLLLLLSGYKIKSYTKIAVISFYVTLIIIGKWW